MSVENTDRMEQAEVPQNLENQPSDIDFTDLETLLQRGLGNGKLKVVNFQTKCLLPAGENYSSLVIKIDAIIRSNENAHEEELHLVAKAKIPTSEHEEIWACSMKKEVFLYTELLPMYRDMERKAGIPENDLIDILPKYVGHRYSLKNTDEADGDALIVMENMKVKGYYNFDRHIGLNLEHARKALTSLARYHALGIAMKQKHPSFAQIVFEKAEPNLTDKTLIEQAFDLVPKAFQKYTNLTKYMDVIDSSMKYETNKWFYPEKRPIGLWDTINHGDFWSNNMLFHKNEEGQVDDVRFVDWSQFFHVSALSDIPYFLCTSLERTNRDSYFDELLAVYYDTFITALKRLGCDTSPFTRQSFDAELKKQALNEISLCALAIKFIEYKVEKEDEDNRELFKNVYAKESDAYEVSLTRIIDIYKARKWL